MTRALIKALLFFVGLMLATPVLGALALALLGLLELIGVLSGALLSAMGL